MIGAVGRYREMARGVVPVLVQAMIALASESRAARHAAAESDAVMRWAGGAPCASLVCCWPSAWPQP